MNIKKPWRFPNESINFNPFGDSIGLVFEESKKGNSLCTVKVKESLINPHNVVHGGVLFTMADTGMGGALYTELKKGESCATVEIKISYFKAVTSGILKCKSTIVNKGRRIATIESEIVNEGVLVAKATGTFFITKQEK